MLDLVSFFYSNATLTAVLTIGAWVGTAAGAVAAVILILKYFKWENRSPSHDLGGYARRYVRYVGLSAILIVGIVLGAMVGFCLGAISLTLAWLILPLALIGGLIGLALSSWKKNLRLKRSLVRSRL